MKKLLGITILLLLFCTNINAKDIKLVCKDMKDEGISHVLMINDNDKTLKVEDVPSVYYSLDVGTYNNDEIEGDYLYKIAGKAVQQMTYNIDRRTGVLTLKSFFFEDKKLYKNKSNCELFKKNKF